MRNQIFFLMFVFAFLFFSCDKKKEQRLLSDEKLIPILVDLHIAEASLNKVRGAARDSLEIKYFEDIEKIHEASRETIEHDLNILKSEPEVFVVLYEQVVLSLKAKEAYAKDVKSEKANKEMKERLRKN